MDASHSLFLHLVIAVSIMTLAFSNTSVQNPLFSLPFEEIIITAVVIATIVIVIIITMIITIIISILSGRANA